MTRATSRRRRITALHLYVGVVFVILFLPLAVLVLFSFSGSGQLRFPIHSVSLKWYREIFNDSSVTSGIMTSLKVAVGTALVVTVVGTAAALALYRAKFRGSGIVVAVILAPAAIPGLVIGIALLNFYGDIHTTLSTWTVIAGHIVYTLPFFYLILSTRLRRFDPALTEAAADLGANPWQRFQRVIGPITAPAIIAAAFVVLALSWDEFQITFFTIGQQSTLPLVIWSRARLTIDPSVNAIGTLMVAGSLAVVLLTQRFIVDSYQ